VNTSQSGSPGSQFNYTDIFEAAYREQAQRIGRFNLAVFGKTGAGKSSLVNAVFGDTVAETGIGKPVTTGTTCYEHPSGTFGMFDCVGFETGESGDDILANLRVTVEAYRDRPLADQIPVAWYVLRWSDRRFEDAQGRFVRELRAIGLPVVVVLTQVPITQSGEVHPDALQLAEHITAEVGDAIVTGAPIFTNSVADPHLGQQVHGLMPLLEATFMAAPEGVRTALTAAQRIDLARKRRDCEAIVATTTATAAGIGAIPIPFADAIPLFGAQVIMMATIATRYALPVNAGVVSSLAIAATLTGGAASWGGRALANLVKLIPGAGSAAGGMINASIAATLTGAIGAAWIKVCEYLVTLTPAEIEALLGNDSALRSIFLTAFKAQVARAVGSHAPSNE
jgi:uncharacterized protein (DUF697 family)/GTP-binding protein EngB required for normal cell division